MSSIENKNYIRILIPLFFSLIIIVFSFYGELWVKFWTTLNIPATYPPFDDSQAINRAVEFKKQGLNPYQASSTDPFNYPSIWIIIYDFFDLKNFYKFKLFNFFVLYSYFFVLTDLFLKIKNKYFKLTFIFFLFSTSNFLIIERLNLEIIIFCFLYFVIINKKYLIQNVLFFFSFVLKIHPIFSIFILIKNKKNFLFILFLSIIYLIIMKDEIFNMRNNMIEFALIFAYGIGSITKAIYYYSVDLNYLVDENNYNYFRNFMVLLAGIYATLLVMIKFSFKEKSTSLEMKLEEKLFLCGSGIFIGTFITSSSIDYRLLYLLLTVPIILSSNNKKIITIYLLSLIICFNSMHFEGGNSYSLIYFFKASFIYFLKFIIFSVNCYYFGIVLNKYVDKSFFKI